jgi:hypothetical protein
MASTAFYEFHLLHDLPGCLIPSGIYQRASFSARPSSTLSTFHADLVCISLTLSYIEKAPNSFLLSSFVMLSLFSIRLHTAAHDRPSHDTRESQ